jgi:glycerate kinase
MFKKIVVASDSFKGSLTSLEVADSVEKAVREAFPQCDVVKVNVADGGEGTMDALRQTLGGTRVNLTVSGPLGRPVEAYYVILDDGITAVLEMSAASGLPLLAPEERNPSKTSTYGTGELIRDALGKGCTKFLVGIGGSATNDAGMGMLSALGYRFLDSDGAELEPVGGSLGLVESILSPQWGTSLDAEAGFIVACDVKAPLYGPEGAAYVFAPQKGADPQMVQSLDAGLRHFAEVAAQVTGSDFSQMQGAGAAGGLGYAFKEFLNARLERGVEMVLDAIGFDELIAGADLVITGEGRVDSQTLTGKTPFGVAQRAIRQGIPVVAIGGSVAIDPHQAREAGFKDALQVTPEGMPLSEAMKQDVASENVYRTILKLMKDYE